MQRNKPGLTIYTFGMITVLAAVISATTTVFIATRHGEMAARIDALQQQLAAEKRQPLGVQLGSTKPLQQRPRGDLDVYVGAYQPQDKQAAMLQFWIPAEGFKVSSDSFSAEEKAVCENDYGVAVDALETEIMTYAKGWNVTDINGCWAPSDCTEGACAVCEPGKILTVALDSTDKMNALADRLAAPDKGLIRKLFCQDATLLVMNSAAKRTAR